MNLIYELMTLWNIVPLIAVGIVLVCLRVAFREGEKDNDNYPDRWRRRAVYLRWLSMAELAAMGVLVVLIVRVPKSPGHDDSGVLGTTIVLGIIAAMMAGVYRYIIRLGYFYEARADAMELLTEKPGTKSNEDAKTKLDFKDESNLIRFILLCRAISPDGLEYAETESLAGEVIKLKKDLLDKK